MPRMLSTWQPSWRMLHRCRPWRVCVCRCPNVNGWRRVAPDGTGWRQVAQASPASWRPSAGPPAGRRKVAEVRPRVGDDSRVSRSRGCLADVPSACGAGKQAAPAAKPPATPRTRPGGAAVRASSAGASTRVSSIKANDRQKFLEQLDRETEEKRAARARGGSQRLPRWLPPPFSVRASSMARTGSTLWCRRVLF